MHTPFRFVGCPVVGVIIVMALIFLPVSNVLFDSTNMFIFDNGASELFLDRWKVAYVLNSINGLLLRSLHKLNG